MDRTETFARSAMRGAVGRRSPSPTRAIEASTMASRVRRARAVRPSIASKEVSVRCATMSNPSLLALSDRILRGDDEITDHHPMRPSNQLEEVGDGVAFVDSFANVSAISTPDGLCLVDTGSVFAAAAVHSAVRSWSNDRATTAVYTHGHIDHVFGTGAFEEEGPMGVVSHDGVEPRFDRYQKPAGYNAVINQRQFRTPGLQWPLEYPPPDLTSRDRLDLDLGGITLELHHAR